MVAESWLNNSATNETRGQALSLYVIVQMVGIVVAQSIINLADPAGWTLFVLMSVAVSVAFLPILLDVSPAPMFETTKPMSLSELYQVSPLGMVGIFFLGTIFSALFGMGSVYGTERGLSVTDISIFMGAIFVGGMILQYPIGWVSDRMDRRRLIIGITGLGAISMVLGAFMTESRWVVFGLAFLAGGLANPLYSLLIAYTNDFLEHEDMAAASGGLIFANGVGAVSGPFLVGLVMNAFGADSYFLFIAVIMALVAGYGLYRMTQRPAPSVEDTSAYAQIAPQASPVAIEVAQEVAIEMALEEEAAQEDLPAS
ncbi:MAG: MFS transporter [Pseudomonadota bacterium]